MAASDEETIRAVLTGDVGRFAELVDRYQAWVQRVAFSFLGNYEDARDVSQDAFVSAFRALGRFRGGARFSTWLYRIVVNECKDAFKHRARRPMAVASVGAMEAVDDDAAGGLFVEVADPTAGPSDQASNQELSRRISAEIGGLPFKQRTAFLLHHVHGLPLADVAAVMGCRIGTVKSHLFRATERLRAQLVDVMGTEEGR